MNIDKRGFILLKINEKLLLFDQNSDILNLYPVSTTITAIWRQL